MGGGGSPPPRVQTTTQQATLAPEFRPLVGQTGQRILGLQAQAPVSPFLAPSPLQVAPLSPTQRLGISGVGRVTQRPFTERVATGQILGLPREAGRVPGEFGQLPGLAERVPGQFTRLSGAAGQVPSQFATLGQLAGRRPTGVGLELSPSIQAAQRAFEATVAPGIINQATLAGLGRSTAVPQALASAEAEFLAPLFEAELAREERAIGREADARLAEALAAERGIGRGVETGLAEALATERAVTRGVDAATQAALAQERGIGREAAARQFGIPQLVNIGGLESGRLLSQIQAAQTLGAVERDVGQAANVARLQDVLRRQALAEQALFIPFGSLAPSAIGTQATSIQRGGGGGGGIFK